MSGFSAAFSPPLCGYDSSGLRRVLIGLLVCGWFNAQGKLSAKRSPKRKNVLLLSDLDCRNHIVCWRYTLLSTCLSGKLKKKSGLYKMLIIKKHQEKKETWILWTLMLLFPLFCVCSCRLQLRSFSDFIVVCHVAMLLGNILKILFWGILHGLWVGSHGLEF